MDVEDKREYPGEAELLVLMYEFKENLEKYLATSNSPYKTLSELINFNDANKEQVLKHFDQSIFIDSDKTSSLKNEYLIALEQIIDTRNGIDQLLEENNIDALVGIDSKSFLKNRTILIANGKDGSNFPFSIALIVCLLTSRYCPNSCWLSFFSRRRIFKLFFTLISPVLN